MADIEYWIQLENRPWDVCPKNIDRMHGTDIEHITGAKPASVTITSPETGVSRTVTMYHPTNDGTETVGSDQHWKVVDALILRRYKPPEEADGSDAWTVPDDRRVNPWDLNEPNPTDNGTMGTIPGATLECNVGDKIIVHFRNKDFRAAKDVKARTHSLHPHGIVFAPIYDGAFPLSPPDTSQPVGGEAALWSSVGVGGFKKGDRVPPGAAFDYTWDTFGWPATAGIWHYHDHSICDAENVLLGAMGFLIIHNPADPDDVIIEEGDLPGGEHNGSPTRLTCFDINLPFLPLTAEAAKPVPEALQRLRNERKEEERDCDDKLELADFVLDRGGLTLEPNFDFTIIRKICFPVFRDPPKNAQYLQLYHELPGCGMLISGRKFLGNAPTVIGGVDTKMRFGVAGMNREAFHTFHLHGHRWVIPGPVGTDPIAIQSSPQLQAVSQFEDTRVFGAANSFGFTIQQGSFMGSRFTPDPSRAPGLGEWHMHCHVLGHMMPGGMMGSLLVINGGEIAFGLPRGMMCPKDDVPADTIEVQGFAFNPNNITVLAGSNIVFHFKEANHTVETLPGGTTGAAQPININNGGGPLDAVPVGQQIPAAINGNPGDQINYRCGIHNGMTGTINIS